MSKLIVVIGITGQQGGSVARIFNSLPDWRVRGITRDPSKPSATALREAGMDLVAGDLDDPASLEKAFTGATAIFAVTDFWQFLSDPSTFTTAAEQNIPPNQLAMQREIAQGKNIFSAAATPAVLATLDRFVFSTLSDSRRWSQGAITHNLHFDGKAQLTANLKATYSALAAKTSYLQMGYYLSNWKFNPRFAPLKQEDGSYRILSAARPQGEGGKAIPYVDPPNDTGYFVKALVEVAPPETEMLGYCEELHVEEYARLWGEVKGVECKFEHLSEERIEKDIKGGELPECLMLEVTQSERYFTTYGWAGGDPNVKHPRDVGVEMDKLTKVAEYIRKEDYTNKA